MALNTKLDQIDLDIYRTFFSQADFAFLVSGHGTFSRIDHILGHKNKPVNQEDLNYITYSS